MKSIRTSLITGCVIGAGAVFALSSVAIYRGARATLVRQLDEGLESQARVIASVVKRTPDGMEVEVEDVDIPEYTSPGGDGYLQLWLDADSVLYRSPRLAGRDLDASISPELDRPVFRWTRVGSLHARAVDLRTHAVVDPEDWEEVHQAEPPAPAIRLVAAREARSLDAFLSRLRVLLIAVAALAGLVVAFVLAAVIRRSLQPLDQVAREISSLSDDLSARVRVAPTPREVKPVVDQLNALLARLDDAFQRERTFSGDIAHELRTPLAGLRSSLEVTLTRPREAHDYQRTMESALVIVRRVQAMVETLLYLGRLESGQVEVEQQAVDLCALARGVWQSLEETARARKLTVTWTAPDEAVVRADPVLLEVALRNILDNAVTYVDDAGSIRIDVSQGGRDTTLVVANSGCRIAQEQVGDLLRRFTRADASRNASDRHFGLGLAITSKIAAALHGRLDVQSSEGGEFRVLLALQRA